MKLKKKKKKTDRYMKKLMGCRKIPIQMGCGDKNVVIAQTRNKTEVNSMECTQKVNMCEKKKNGPALALCDV